jgi:RNA polymerase sigma-70 factor (ECF subfamily)
MHALAVDIISVRLRRRPNGVGRSKARERLFVTTTPAPSMSALIVTIAERGDREAFTVLFNHFAPRVKSYLLKLGASSETADELAQETLLTVWRKARAFDPARAAASTWIFAIARNLRIDVARREVRHLPGEDPLIDEPPSPGARLEAAQDERRLAVALAALPDEQLQVVRLAYFSDQPHTEIADDLSLPLGTVKSRMRLAMAKLRAMLDTVP